MSNPLTLYPHLAASVNIDCLSQEDQDLLARLSAHNREKTEKQQENLQEIFAPKVSQLSAHCYQLDPVGSNYSKPARNRILDNWRLAGASPYLLAILAAAQEQLISRLIIDPNGMIPEKRKPAKIGKIGKKKLKGKEVRNLLLSLKLSHQLDWPLEQLANIVRPYAKRTRRKKGK
jgi:hypothetical protein